MPSSNLNVINLDFDGIKASIRDFLRSQQQFLDYNFEGASLSVLLDVLSYNTHYLSFYLSMIGSEMFLDSATLRSSVVSLAKQLGYTPQSILAPRAIVSLTITPNDGATNMVLQQGTRFNTNVNGVNYIFVTDQSYTATLENGQFVFPNVTLVEGIPYTYQMTVDNSIPNQQFILPSAQVDTTTLTVQVQNSATDSTLTAYTLADNFLQVTATSQVYFLQETETGAFQVLFGDGVIGQSVSDGNIIAMNYIITNGPDANQAAIFVPAQPLNGYPLGNVTVSTVVAASGGSEAELIESIRFNAPKSFETQGRAVTASDYVLLIKNNYKNADSVIVWGGETETPPQYGKVFISIKPVNGYVVTQSEKQNVLANIINQRNIVSVIPQFVDPDYTFLIVNSTVKYIPANTTKTLGTIQNLAYNAILKFASSELDQFAVDFKYSRLLSAIDNADPSISNNLTTIQMRKTFSPTLNTIQTYIFSMNAAVVPGSFSSSVFVTQTDPLLLAPYVGGNTYYMVDDGGGNINMMQSSLGIPDRVARNCGSIDYTKGLVTISQIMPTSVSSNGTINITMTPAQNDISPVTNNILFINSADVTVNVVPVTS